MPTVSSLKALIVFGGWDGHQPKQVAHFFADMLRPQFDVTLSDSLGALDDVAALAACDLFVPVWTMGKISDGQLNNVCAAVRDGLGIAGCHGGMCDSFREATEWQFMTGGQWVAHPGNDGIRYTVLLKPDPITQEIGDFEVISEQYYMHIDPAVRVLATTRFPTAPGPHAPNGPVDMPVVWTKRYGAGRVFYCSLGHNLEVISQPPVTQLMQRGFHFASRRPITPGT